MQLKHQNKLDPRTTKANSRAREDDKGATRYSRENNKTGRRGARKNNKTVRTTKGWYAAYNGWNEVENDARNDAGT